MEHRAQDCLLKDPKTNLFAQPFYCQVVQLEELMAVRHSVFVLGGAGTGKSQVGFYFFFY